MKNIVVVLSILALCACDSSKKKVESPDNSVASLEQRLTGFMKLNEEMNLEKIMDYIYPKLFDIVPRNELLKAMKNGFDNEYVKIDLDSMKVDKIHPVFEMDKGSYAKITYSMVMLMSFKNSKDSADANDNSQNELIKASMAEKYGEENVSMDEATGIIRIHTASPMVAVKDELAKEWCFVNLNEGDSMLNKLFSKEVLDKLATYK
jgi:hypothetical protein